MQLCTATYPLAGFEGRGWKGRKERGKGWKGKIEEMEGQGTEEGKGKETGRDGKARGGTTDLAS